MAHGQHYLAFPITKFTSGNLETEGCYKNNWLLISYLYLVVLLSSLSVLTTTHFLTDSLSAARFRCVHTQTLMFTTNAQSVNTPQTHYSSSEQWIISPNLNPPNPENILALWSWRPSESAPQVSRARAAWPCTSHTDSWSKTSGHLWASRLWWGLGSRRSWNMTESTAMHDGCWRCPCGKRRLWETEVRAVTSWWFTWAMLFFGCCFFFPQCARWATSHGTKFRSGCYLDSYLRLTWMHFECYLRTAWSSFQSTAPFYL